MSKFQSSFDIPYGSRKNAGTDFRMEPAKNESGFILPDFWNGTIFPEIDFESDEEVSNIYKIAYIAVSLFCIALCFVAFLINIRMVSSIPYIKRPISPTTIISLSLAVSDTISSGLIATNFILNSILPRVFGYKITNECIILVLEAFRLSGILVSTFHVFLLAIYHYIGVNRPLQVKTIVTKNILRTALCMVWIVPTLYIFTYFALVRGQGFQRADCHVDPEHNFLQRAAFRESFSIIFGVTMVLMSIIYIHVFVIIKKHRARILWFSRHSRQRDDERRGRPTDRQEGHSRYRHDGNVTAVHTSLFILLTYLTCFVPAVAHFCLVCYDCVIPYDSVKLDNMLVLSSIINVLLISKYLLNPIIYSARMPEIQTALREMDATWKRRICFFRYPEDDLGLPPLRPDQRRWWQFSFLRRRRRPENIELRTIRMQGHERRAQYNVTAV